MNLTFDNTETAFAHLSDRQLKKRLGMFALLNKTNISTMLSSWAEKFVRWRVPFAQQVVKATIFEQFLGGETLRESLPTIAKLDEHHILTALDYAVEGKSNERDLDKTVVKFLEGIDFAAGEKAVPVFSIKISALGDNAILELKADTSALMTDEENAKFERITERLHKVCAQAHAQKVKIFVDAEESWIQDCIDELVMDMMKVYNHGQITVYNTYQMYRKDRLDVLKEHYAEAERYGFLLGAKLVRGAYMEKERSYAMAKGIPSPIHDTKADTDTSFDKAVAFCVKQYEKIGICAATHNEESCKKFAKLISELKTSNNHPNLNFCQLLGMGDHISFNLAQKGYNVAKYVPYGTVEEALPYLTRRAQENSAVQGEFSREYKLLLAEWKRRKSS